MKKLTSYLLTAIFCFFAVGLHAQREVQTQNIPMTDKVNDFNTPLHMLKPEYKTPYGLPTVENVKSTIDRILAFLEAATPARVINKETNHAITDFSKIDKNSVLEQGKFRLASYEWGVTYSGMLLVAQTTGDKRYKKYVSDRFNFLADVAPAFRKLDSEGVEDMQMRQVLNPKALDDAGAMCSAMIKAQVDGMKFNGRPLIDNYMNYIMNKQFRLTDGTLARTHPHKNTVWIDDMYMSIPAIANMGRLTGDKKYYDEALKQVKQFSERLFVKEKGIYRHGWVEGMTDHPSFHWGRANGWALLTTVEVLDALPENYPGRENVLVLLQAHVRGLAALQSSEGMWHQLLDRNDSYLETSCTAIYTFCIAHAINKGWIDAKAYGPVAVLGWNAIASKVNPSGEVEGTCVGTGMAFDPGYYYYRPVNKYAAHGYGPVLSAGGEMIRLLKTMHPKVNDNSVQFYDHEIKTNEPIFHEE